jgi:flagellar hook-associated protein 3 FlgL
MTPGISPSSELFLSNLQKIESRISTAERQLSSGLRVSQASDAPDQISSILQLRAQIAGVQQTQENLSTVTPQVQSAGSAIQQAIQVLDTATSMATEASGSTTSATQQTEMAPQVQGLLRQLVSLSQTSVNGQFIFNGDHGGESSYGYTMNAAGDGVVPPATQPGPPGQIGDINGVPISLGLTGQQIFDDQGANGQPAADNVFAAVTGLLTARQKNDTAGVETALTNIQAASVHLNDESSFYGAAQNDITDANNSATTTLAELQQQLSNEQDADAATAAENLQSALTDEQAAMEAQAQYKPQSLFNYLS